MAFCKRFEGKTKSFSLCGKIRDLGDWLHRSPWKKVDNEWVESVEHGLGLKKIIDQILEVHKSPLSDEEKQSVKQGLEKLYQSNYGNDVIDSTLTRTFKSTDPDTIMNSVTLVKDDSGNYHFINKLNTNWGDLSELLTDMFIKNKEIYSLLFKDGSSSLKEGLYSIKDKLPDLIKQFNIDELKQYTNNSIVNSDAGDNAEGDISRKLTEIGFTEEFIGGNGNFIDMKFGVDLIMSHPEHGVVTIQVKPDNHGKWLNHWQYKNVDWIVTYKGGVKVFDNKSNSEITDTIFDNGVEKVIENFYKTGKL